MSNLESILNKADDLLVSKTGKILKEAIEDTMTKKIRKLLQRWRKMDLRQTYLPFIGHIITSEEECPNTDKVKAIKEMPNLKGSTLQGFVIYLATFLSEISGIWLLDVTLPSCIMDLVANSGMALQKVKKMVSEIPVMRFYVSTETIGHPMWCMWEGLDTKSLVIQCGASEKGLIPNHWSSNVVQVRRTWYQIIGHPMWCKWGGLDTKSLVIQCDCKWGGLDTKSLVIQCDASEEGLIPNHWSSNVMQVRRAWYQIIGHPMWCKWGGLDTKSLVIQCDAREEGLIPNHWSSNVMHVRRAWYQIIGHPMWCKWEGLDTKSLVIQCDASEKDLIPNHWSSNVMQVRRAWYCIITRKLFPGLNKSTYA